MFLSAGIFHLIQTKKISKQEFKQDAQNFRLITRTDEGREKKKPNPTPLLPGPSTLSSADVRWPCLRGCPNAEQSVGEKICANPAGPGLSSLHTQSLPSWSAVTFSLYGTGKGSQLSKSGHTLVKSKGCTSPKPVKLFDFYI